MKDKQQSAQWFDQKLLGCHQIEPSWFERWELPKVPLSPMSKLVYVLAGTTPSACLEHRQLLVYNLELSATQIRVVSTSIGMAVTRYALFFFACQ